jgi:hypothetical protein
MLAPMKAFRATRCRCASFASSAFLSRGLPLITTLEPQIALQLMSGNSTAATITRNLCAGPRLLSFAADASARTRSSEGRWVDKFPLRWCVLKAPTTAGRISLVTDFYELNMGAS